MRILITGAGMVGAHTARELVGSGDEVTLVDVAPREDYVREVAGSAVRLEVADITDLPGLLAIATEVEPDVVVHTAALIGEAAQIDPLRGVRVNVDGTLNVAELVRHLGIRRLVHASTLGVNDLAQPQTQPLTEDFPIGSTGRVYGASKVACEVLLDAWANAYRFELVMLRFAGVYGRGHFAGGSGIGREINDLILAALNGEAARVGPGIPASYEVVHVKDLARGVAAAVHVGRLPHRVYNLGTGALVTPTDVADALRRAVPGATVEVGEPRPDRSPRTQPFDLTRSRAELGYAPHFDLESGLRDLAAELGRDATR
jgi:UDP-glucose 4-epimerase